MVASPVQPLIDAAALQARIRELAAEIRHDSPAVDLHFICVLKGAFLFLADLVRAIDGGVTVDFMTLSSYTGVSSSGAVRLAAPAELTSTSIGPSACSMPSTMRAAASASIRSAAIPVAPFSWPSAR